MPETINNTSPGDLFIFYGLLKQGAAGAPAHIPLWAAGQFLGPCRFFGEMVDAGGYPGVRPDANRVCEGAVYRLDDISISPQMDAFEGCDMTDPEGSLYLRGRTQFFDGPSNAPEGEAWIYWFNADNAALPVIEAGLWPLNGRWRQQESEAS